VENVRCSSSTTLFPRAEASLRSWRAALFFVYSYKVNFSPIRSQSGSRPPSSKPQPAGSCSPKSAFVLAEKVRTLLLGVSDLSVEQLGKIAVQPLRDRAREDLLQKITAKNLMVEYFSKFVNSCVCPLSSLVTLVYPLVFHRHQALLHIIHDMVRKTRTTETYSMVRKKFVESTGDDSHASPALELFLREMIENNRQITGQCKRCRRGYIVPHRSSDGKCHSCANRDRIRF